MVIESPTPRQSKLPDRAQFEARLNGDTRLAAPMDRLAAAVLDWLVIMTPILVALVAPLRRQMMESLIFETQADFAKVIVMGAMLGLAVIFLYQTLFIYFFGSTPGKMVFGLRVVDVWRQGRPSLEASALRAVVWISEMAMAGSPMLSIFSNPLRRTVHDKLADTVVITTRRSAVVAPTQIQAAFIRGIHSAVLASIIVLIAASGLEFARRIQDEEKILGWMGHAGKNLYSCDAVSDAVEIEGDQESRGDQRLKVAMELFAGGLISQKCLSQEADAVLNKDGQPPALGYLAKAFANSENADESNEYLAEACKLDEEGEACKMTNIVQNWSDENWDKVAEIFENLPANSSSHVLIWKVRYLMRQGQYEQAMGVIDRLSGRSSLAEYIIPERVKALWRSNHFEEAKLVATTAFETLVGRERLNLSGWMCYEELARQCLVTVPRSCEQLIKDAHRDDVEDLQAPGWLALVLLKEKCDGTASSKDYAEIKDAAGEGVIESLVANLDLWSRGDKDAAKNEMKKLILSDKAPEAVRAEGLRRMLGWTEGGDELKPWIKHWQELRPGPRRALGPVLYRALKSRGELSEALAVGWQILNENRSDLEINRDLVVTAYQMGRRKDAWALLKSYRERYDMINGIRTPATLDEFVTISRLLNKEHGEK